MSSQASPVVHVVDTSDAGAWRVFARRPGQPPVEITYFRGVPTQYGTMTRQDPFGPQAMQLTFPKVTIWDAIGVGELAWLAYGTDIDVVWDGPLPVGYPGDAFSWEGYVVSFDYSSSGLQVTLIGAMLQLDNYLAKPEYLERPIPYEWAIRRQWDGHPDLRLKPLQIDWPQWWRTVYSPPSPGTRRFVVPTHVGKGQKWTGMVTRQTGSWDPALTSYVQQLLTSMYTERGRWTLDLERYRLPVLRHRDFKTAADDSTLIADPALPGVDASLNVDWSQSLNVAYGQGRSRSGEGYTGMLASVDGTRTTYEPLAALRSVHPIGDRTGWLDTSRMRKEINLQLQEGLTYDEAKKVGQDHLRRFTDPGCTGTVVFSTDPRWGDGYLPRALIKEGMSLQLPGVFGRADGVLLHITSVSTDFAAGTTSCSVDSKYRDAMTVAEIKQRGRDALSVTRQLIGGQYQAAVPDMLLPWNYSAGSGYIPSGPDLNSRPMFDGMPDDVQFPWTRWTIKRPPRVAAWRKSYVRIPARNANADKNWSYQARRDGGVVGQYGIPIKMAQAGSIRLMQIAAYDADGNLMPLRFHFSIYSNRGVNVKSMPRITAADVGTSSGFPAGQHYPFFSRAWETHQADGTQNQTEDPVSVSSAGLVRGWGTWAIPAGYWPSSPLTAGALPTGMLLDESSWEFSTVDNTGAAFNQYTPTQSSPDAGYLYGMIYCESPDQDVYFAGRMFIAPPGSSV